MQDVITRTICIILRQLAIYSRNNVLLWWYFFMDLLLFSQSLSYLSRDWSFVPSFAFGATLAWLNRDRVQSTFSGLSERVTKKIKKSWTVKNSKISRRKTFTDFKTRKLLISIFLKSRLILTLTWHKMIATNFSTRDLHFSLSLGIC